MRAYKAAKGFKRPINSDISSVPVDEELLEVHANLVARRNLILNRRYHSRTNDNYFFGDLVQVYKKHGDQKGEAVIPQANISN